MSLTNILCSCGCCAIDVGSKGGLRHAAVAHLHPDGLWSTSRYTSGLLCEHYDSSRVTEVAVINSRGVGQRGTVSKQASGG